MRLGIESRVFVNGTEHEFGLMMGNIGPLLRRRDSTAAEES